MAEEQGRRFEQVFADPANKELAARTYRAEQRPTASSTSGRELQTTIERQFRRAVVVRLVAITAEGRLSD
jgi:hypothetical protein